MYSLTICFGPTNTTWSFLFKTEDRARANHQLIVDVVYPNNGTAAVTDDFGQSAVISGVHGVLFEDLEQLEQARIERSLVDAHAQVKFNKRIETDPVMREARRQQQTAPILQPMGGGFRQ
jgi:hypothetical protein